MMNETEKRKYELYLRGLEEKHPWLDVKAEQNALREEKKRQDQIKKDLDTNPILKKIKQIFRDEGIQ